MAKHEHFILDDKGLRELLVKIKNYYASQESLSSEKHARHSGDELLQALDDEIRTRDSETSSLDERLTQEVEDRSNAITTEHNQRVSAVEDLNTSLLSEAETRQDQIDDVINKIKSLYYKDPDSDEETGVLAEKVSELINLINQEVSDRQDAISQEVTDRNNAILSAIETEAQNRADAIATEAQTRINQDISLQGSIDTANANISDLTTRVGSLEDGTALDTEMSDTSEFGVQNKVIKKYIDDNTFRYTFKGTVTNYEDLPTEGLSKGDMYNVINPCNPDEDHHYQGNTNFVWDGNSWFALSSSIDLSAYYTKSETYSIQK